MRTLWQRMVEIFGHRWTSAYGDDAGKGAGVTWAKGLSGLAPTQLGAGLEAVLVAADPWPPTLPEFRSLCLGVPSIGDVRAMVAKRTGAQSPFVRLVWQHIDGWNFARSDQHAADRMLRDAYEIAREHVMRGGALPEQAAGELAHQPAPQPVVEVKPAADAIASLASVFGRPSPSKPATPAPAHDLAAAEADLQAHYAAVRGTDDATGEP